MNDVIKGHTERGSAMGMRIEHVVRFASGRVGALMIRLAVNDVGGVNGQGG